VHRKATNLNTMPVHNIFDKRCLPNNLDQLLTCIPILVNLANISGSHRLIERDGDGMRNAAEPTRDVRDETDFGSELSRNLALVDVIRQAVGYHVIGE
jgi:hypothetical protein